jgi:hypothetical protein
MTTTTHHLLMFAGCAAIAGCSDATGVGSAGTLAPLYHLRSIDGTSVPFTSADGEVTDSGRVMRLGGDTVRVDLIRHSPGTNGLPGTVVISFGTWHATQSGNVVALYPLLASTLDTATVAGDTLTLRAHVGGSLVQTNVYVAP